MAFHQAYQGPVRQAADRHADAIGNDRLGKLEAMFEAIQVAVQIGNHVQKQLKDPKALQAESQILKSDASPVTVADLAIQAVILKVLNTVYPEYRIAAEESAAQLRADPNLFAAVKALAVNYASQNPYVWLQGGSELEDPDDWFNMLDRAAGLDIDNETETEPDPNEFWVVDPIDGTAAFLRGEQYAINIALVSNGEEVLSMIACPCLTWATTQNPQIALNDTTDFPLSGGCVLYAVKGAGAGIIALTPPISPGHLNFYTCLRRVLSPIKSNVPSRLLSCTATKVSSGHSIVHERVATELNAIHPHCDLTSWVLRWVALALGFATYTVWVYKEADRFAKIWDHAGAMLLFTELGGKITDLDGKQIDLNVGSAGRLLSRNRGFVAAPKGETFDRVFKAVKEALREAEDMELVELGSSPDEKS